MWGTRLLSVAAHSSRAAFGEEERRDNKERDDLSDHARTPLGGEHEEGVKRKGPLIDNSVGRGNLQ